MVENPASAEPGIVLDAFWKALTEHRRDLPQLLRTIADRVVEILGDGCVLTTVTEDGLELRPEAIAHADDDVAAAMRDVLGQGNMRVGEGIAGGVASDRRPVLLNDLPADVVDETTPIRFLPFVRDHPMQALMIVPLMTGGELMGTLGAVRTSSSAPYTRADLRLLESLADRAALALADAIASPSTVEATDYEAAYRLHQDGILITVPDGHILAANPAACAILRMTERKIVHGGRGAIVVVDDPNLEPGLAARARAGHARGELRLRRGDDTVLVADVSSTIYTSPDGRMRSTVTIREITDELDERQLLEQRLAQLEDDANLDALTGLLNRRAFAEACHRLFAAADRRGRTSHLVFVDVDGLKATNDAEGHSAGDTVLRTVAAAVQRAAGPDDVVARLGGDEFVIVTETTAQQVRALVDRVRHALAVDASAPSGITLSVGIAERPPRDGRRLEDLVDAADREMYRQRMLRRLRER